MRKLARLSTIASMATAIICGTGLSLSVQAASNDNNQAATIKLDLTDTIRKSLGKRRLGYGRPIRSSGIINGTMKADLVTVNFDLSAQGSDAGKTISALAEKKDLLVKAAKELNIAVLRTSTSSLNVRSRSVRSFTADGNRTNKNVFKGKMGVLFTFKAGEDVLVNIGKIADDRVSSVSRMQFSFSQGEWEKQSADLKKRAMAKARANAEDQAEQQGRTLKNMTRSSFREPRRRTRNLQQLIDVQVTARVTYNVE